MKLQYFSLSLITVFSTSVKADDASSSSDGCNISDIQDQFKGYSSSYQYELATNKNNLEYLSVSCVEPEEGVNNASSADVEAYNAMKAMVKDSTNTQYQKWGRFKCNKYGKWVPLWPGWGNMEYCPSVDEWAYFQDSGWVEEVLNNDCSNSSIEFELKSANYNPDNYNIEYVTREVTASMMTDGIEITCKGPTNGEDGANYADVKAFKEFSKYVRQEDKNFMTARLKCNNSKMQWIANSPAEQEFPFECPDAKDWKTFWEGHEIYPFVNAIDVIKSYCDDIAVQLDNFQLGSPGCTRRCTGNYADMEQAGEFRVA